MPSIVTNTFLSNKGSLRGLSDGANRIKDTPNAGGNSINSEILSFELRHLFFGANLSRTEMELEYFPMGGSISDYSVTLWGKQYGVSVARAMQFKHKFNKDDAKRLLTKKLKGIISSSKTVCHEQWEKQILHIWVQNQDIADLLVEEYRCIDDELKSNTLVMLTVVEGNGDIIFKNK